VSEHHQKVESSADEDCVVKQADSRGTDPMILETGGKTYIKASNLSSAICEVTEPDGTDALVATFHLDAPETMMGGMLGFYAPLRTDDLGLLIESLQKIHVRMLEHDAKLAGRVQ
jgi:hypothetical protein